jgi:Putative peptidoglycan binding domain
LHELGYFAGSVDGHFGDDTGLAVHQLLEHAGLAAGGPVDRQVWAALAAAEQATGRSSPVTPDDQHWHWDGDRWQPNGDAPGGVGAASAAEAQVDASGQWIWDGEQWQPVVG